MDVITARAMYPYISILLNESERREAEDASFDMEARARGYVPERMCVDVNSGCTFVCSECGANVKDRRVGMSYVDDSGVRWYTTSNDHSFNYCPNCGARVKEGE